MPQIQNDNKDFRKVICMRIDDLNLIYEMYYTISRRWNAEWNEVNKNQLSVTQATALEILVTEGEQKASDLADLLSITTGGVTGITDKLVKKGLIERTKDEDDRRVVNLVITNLGRKTYEIIQQERIEMMEKLFGGLTETEMQELIKIHQKLQNNYVK